MNKSTEKPIANRMANPNLDQESQKAMIESKLLNKIVNKVPSFGILIAFLAGFFYIISFLMVKWTPNVNCIVLLSIRSFFQAFVYGIPIAIQRKPFFSNARVNAMLILRGLLSYLCGWFFYESVRLIPFGDATSIAQSAPIYTTVIAYFFLKESFSWLQTFCLCLSLTGVALVAKPEMLYQLILNMCGDEHVYVLNGAFLRGTVYAFMTALFSALCYVIIRKLNQASVMLVLFWFSMGSLLFGLIHLTWLRFYGDQAIQDSLRLPNTVQEWSFALVSSLGGLVGQYLVNLALKVEEAGPISLVRTADILLSYVLQAFILQNEPVQLSSLLGAFTIFVAIVLATAKKWATDGKNPPKLLVRIFASNGKTKEMKDNHISACDSKIVHIMRPDNRSACS